MAYVIPNSEDNTKYDLYIGADGGVIANENSAYLFYSFINLKSIKFNNNFDTNNVINMSYMFAGGNSLVTLDVSSFNTSNVLYMTAMFSAWNVNLGDWSNHLLENLIGIETFDTSKVVNMGDMFSGQPLISLNLSNFNTSKVINMWHMFNACEKLTTLNLCSFDTKNVVKANNMFANMLNVKNIYVGPNWTTTNADTTDMFYNSNVSDVTYGQC